MSDPGTTAEKAERPHAHFEAPHEVLVDPELSKEQKVEALDRLEQDARQLAIASSEGMADGEATGLQEVLHAQSVLSLPPLAIAYEVVLQDLRLKSVDGEDEALKAATRQVITALEGMRGAGRTGG